MKSIARTFLGLTVAVLLLGVYSCRTHRYIPEQEYLYTGTEVKISATHNIEKEGRLNAELNSLARPKPNSKFLGARWGLWAHYRGQREKSSFIINYLNKKFGEKPVYLSHVSPQKTTELMINRLENKGYFLSDIDFEVKKSKQHATVQYIAEVSRPYLLKSFHFPTDTSVLTSLLQESMEKSSLKEGMRFDLGILKEERIRMNQYLKENGFYLFNDDFIIFKIDTNQYDNRKFDLYFDLKNNVPPEALLQYKIGEISVNTDYNVQGDSISEADTIHYENIRFIQPRPNFNIELLPDYILLEKGQLYNQKLHRFTTNRLSSVGNFKFVSTRFQLNDSTATDSIPTLTTDILLSPHNKRTLRAEFQATTKSNSFSGPGVIVSYRNRNLFNGGEILEINLKAAYETQLSRRQDAGLNTTELSLSTSITVPRIIAPIKINTRKSYSVPGTKFGLSLSTLNRMQYYRLMSVQGTYGFNWWSSKYNSHELIPVALNLTYASNKTEAFRAILEPNPFLARSFDSQFIPGLRYIFRHNGLINSVRLHRFYIETGLDVAGNLLNLARTTFGQPPSDKMFGLNFASYGRFDVDFRHYFQTSAESKLVSRLFVGVGVPYGDSESLPYIKQYFSGGPNSLRAFPVRSVGPGGYVPSTERALSFFDQSGDIKFEANIEYRFPLISYLHGALFLETGNVWLAKENPAIPGGKFSSNWVNELALGTGVGVRFDFEFLVVRLDLGIPLHDPSQVTSEQWIQRAAPWESSWRKNFMTWNFAIGYPF